jgi:Xaa-Pro aminopeptidase
VVSGEAAGGPDVLGAEVAGGRDVVAGEVAGGWPAHDHAGRRDRLRALLADRELDLLLVTGPANVAYLSGFTGSNGQVLVAREAGEDRLVTDARYEERASAEAPGLAAVLSRDHLGVALDTVREAGGRRLGVEADHLTWSSARDLEDRAAAGPAERAAAGRADAVADERAAEVAVEIVPTSGLVEELRVVKEDAELARLTRACELTVAALEWLVVEVVAVGRTERELAVALERRFVDLGADGVAFPSIVASGPNGAVPHHAPTDRPLAAGDLLTIDCGAQVGGYHADHTRTFAIGHLDDELVALHALVVAAQAAGRAAAVAGATGERWTPRPARSSRRRVTATGSCTAPGTAWGSRSTRRQRSPEGPVLPSPPARR